MCVDVGVLIFAFSLPAPPPPPEKIAPTAADGSVEHAAWHSAGLCEVS